MHHRVCGVFVYVMIRIILFLIPMYFKTVTTLSNWHKDEQTLRSHIFSWFFIIATRETNCGWYSTSETSRLEKGDFLNDLLRSYNGPNLPAFRKGDQE